MVSNLRMLYAFIVNYCHKHLWSEFSTPAHHWFNADWFHCLIATVCFLFIGGNWVLVKHIKVQSKNISWWWINGFIVLFYCISILDILSYIMEEGNGVLVKQIKVQSKNINWWWICFFYYSVAYLYLKYCHTIWSKNVVTRVNHIIVLEKKSLSNLPKNCKLWDSLTYMCIAALYLSLNTT